MSPKKGRQKSVKGARASGKKGQGFTAEERAAMRERIKELRSDKADGESAVLEKIADMQGQDRVMGNRLHAIVRAAAPTLTPKLWYGMPAYARGEKVVCFFQCAQKFKSRYAMIGFSDAANLDEGSMWPTYFALKDLTGAEEARIGALLKKAVS